MQDRSCHVLVPFSFGEERTRNSMVTFHKIQEKSYSRDKINLLVMEDLGVDQCNHRGYLLLRGVLSTVFLTRMVFFIAPTGDALPFDGVSFTVRCTFVEGFGVSRGAII